MVQSQKPVYKMKKLSILVTVLAILLASQPKRILTSIEEFIYNSKSPRNKSEVYSLRKRNEAVDKHMQEKELTYATKPTLGIDNTEQGQRSNNNQPIIGTPPATVPNSERADGLRVFTIRFQSGQTYIRKKYLAEVDKAAEAIKAQYPNITVVIKGHTDDAPIKRSKKYKDNMDLSLSRAEAVRNHLISKLGVPEECVEEAVGLANAMPIAHNYSSESWQNRRVEIKLYPFRK